MKQNLLLEERKHAPARLGRVLILGLGKSGKACAEYALSLLGTRVEAVFVAAGKYSEAAEEWACEARARGARVEFDCEQFDETFDLCIASPGISEFSDFYLNAKAQSAEIMSEVEFAWRESRADARWVAITGTNGKTTTTALTAHVLRAAGFKAKAVGNIGDTCIEAVVAGDTEVYVAEVSSYQLASTIRFAPDAAIVLNVTPDHLSWHRCFEAYADAKWNVLRNLGAGAVAVLDATDDVVRAKVRELKAMTGEERSFAYIPMGTKQGLGFDMRQACGSENAAFVSDDGRLHVALRGVEHDVIAATELQIPGAHNVANALAGASAAFALGATCEAVAAGLASFAPLEHRIEPCGQVDGVSFYNDSKATNVDAVLKALTAFEPVKPIIMLGGRDKGTDLEPLLASCAQHAKAVVCFGEAGPLFADAFEACAAAVQAGLPVMRAGGLADAFATAVEVAGEGDVVLLSPACASFDEFSCYEERGDVFKRLVRDLASTDEA